MASPIGKPFVAAMDGERFADIQPIAQLPLDDGVNEGQLQKLIAAEHRLLPFEYIDERIEGPLTCIGREISLSTGPVDILFLSQNGYLVVVETKLWRNPESRRKVVAQVLDYATQLRQWDFSTLQREWQKQASSKQGLYDFIQPRDYEEAEWIDLVNENLTQGRMALLIVGDGIRSETRQLAESVSGHPDFQFRLGLIELRLYRLGSGDLLAIPTTLARTQEIERAIVRIENGTGQKVTVETPIPARKATGRSVLDEQAFLAELRKNAPAKEGDACERVVKKLLDLLPDDTYIGWRHSAFVIRYKLLRLSCRFSIVYISKGGRLGFWKSVWMNQLSKAFSDKETVQRMLPKHVKRLEKLGAKCRAKDTVDMPLAKLEDREQEVIQMIRESIDELLLEAETVPPRDEE